MMRAPAGLSARNLSAASANSKISSISPLVRSAIDIKFLPDMFSIRSYRAATLPVGHRDLVDAVRFFEQHVDPAPLARVDILPDDVGANGQLPGAAIHQRRNQDPFRLSQPGDRFHRRPDGAPAKNDVIDQP